MPADPIANAWNGCLAPILRNLLLTLLTFVAATAAGIALASWWVFIGIMVGGATIWWWFERRVFVERFNREQRAMNEFLGLDQDR